MRCLLLFFTLSVVEGLLPPLSALAHGDSPSLEAEVSGYLIDIGYEDLAANEDVSFDIDLFRVGPPLEYAEFASVDIRVTKDGTEIVAGSVANDGVHVPSYDVNFPEPGGYDLDVRYLNSQNTLIVARTFHVEVPTPTGLFMQQGLNGLHYVLAAGLLALSIGIAGYSLWQRSFSARKDKV